MNQLFKNPGDRCGWPQAILFDLDGTLVDSIPDLTTSINALFATEALSPLSHDNVRAMVGNGIAKLVERAFKARDIALDGEALAAMTERMMAIYQDHLTDETRLMDGADDILRAYAKVGVKLAVVTNKPEDFARRILERLGLAEVVHAVVGGDTCPTRKPEPEMLLHALSELGWHASRAVMVGDSLADINAAKAAFVASVVVRGGYTTVPVDQLGADVVIDNLHQLPSGIEKLKEPV